MLTKIKQKNSDILVNKEVRSIFEKIYPIQLKKHKIACDNTIEYEISDLEYQDIKRDLSQIILIASMTYPDIKFEILLLERFKNDNLVKSLLVIGDKKNA